MKPSRGAPSDLQGPPDTGAAPDAGAPAAVAPEPEALNSGQLARGFRCIAIVGVGLMGGSLGMALRLQEPAPRVIGLDRLDETLAQAVAVGAIDQMTRDFSELREADCVVFATPVGITPDLMVSAAPYIPPNAVVTDLGSVKGRIVAEGSRLFGAQFIGGHPMAGSEENGIAAARADLFRGASWALVDVRDPSAVHADAAQQLDALVRSLGARPLYLTADLHDHLAALVSHLPHVLAYAFAQAVAADPDAEAAVSMAGGSYRDLTRVSRSSPDLWSDIFLDNRDRLLPALAAFEGVLRDLRAAIEGGDRAALARQLRRRADCPE